MSHFDQNDNSEYYAKVEVLRAALQDDTVESKRIVDFVHNVAKLDNVYTFFATDRDEINLMLNNQAGLSWEVNGIPSKLANQFMESDFAFADNIQIFENGSFIINWFSQDKFNEYNVQILVTIEAFVSLEEGLAELAGRESV